MRLPQSVEGRSGLLGITAPAQRETINTVRQSGNKDACRVLRVAAAVAAEAISAPRAPSTASTRALEIRGNQCLQDFVIVRTLQQSSNHLARVRPGGWVHDLGHLGHGEAVHTLHRQLGVWVRLGSHALEAATNLGR